MLPCNRPQEGATFQSLAIERVRSEKCVKRAVLTNVRLMFRERVFHRQLLHALAHCLILSARESATG